MSYPVYYEILEEKEEDDSNKMVMTNTKLCFTCAVKEVIKGNHVDSFVNSPGTYANTDCEKCQL